MATYGTEQAGENRVRSKICLNIPCFCGFEILQSNSRKGKVKWEQMTINVYLVCSIATQKATIPSGSYYYK